MNDKARESLAKVKAAMADLERNCMDSFNMNADVTNESEGMEGEETVPKMQDSDEKKKMIIAMMKKGTKDNS